MALFSNALAFIRANLELAAQNRKPPIVTIGELSDAQLARINEQRQEHELPPVVASVLFDGRHLYRSRCLKDGYSVDEVLEQISSAFSDSSTVAPGLSTVLVSSALRRDRKGRLVRDEAVFECHGRLPHPELYSVIPKGDGKTSPEKKKAT